MKLDPLELHGRLKPIKVLLAEVPSDELEALLEYMKKTLGLSADYVRALRREITKAAQPDDRANRSADALDALKMVPRIHTAIDFHESFVAIGFRVDQGDEGDSLLLLISEGQGETCPTERGCPPKSFEMISNSDVGQAGHTKGRVV